MPVEAICKRVMRSRVAAAEKIAERILRFISREAAINTVIMVNVTSSAIPRLFATIFTGINFLYLSFSLLTGSVTMVANGNEPEPVSNSSFISIALGVAYP